MTDDETSIWYDTEFVCKCKNKLELILDGWELSIPDGGGIINVKCPCGHVFKCESFKPRSEKIGIYKLIEQIKMEEGWDQ